MESLAEFEMLEQMADEHSFSSQSSLVQDMMSRDGKRQRRQWSHTPPRTGSKSRIISPLSQQSHSLSSRPAVHRLPQSSSPSQQASMPPQDSNKKLFAATGNHYGIRNAQSAAANVSSSPGVVTAVTSVSPAKALQSQLPAEMPQCQVHTGVYEKWLQSLRTPMSSSSNLSNTPDKVLASEVIVTTCSSQPLSSVAPQVQLSASSSYNVGRHVYVSNLVADAAAHAADDISDVESIDSEHASSHSGADYGDDTTWDETNLSFPDLASKVGTHVPSALSNSSHQPISLAPQQVPAFQKRSGENAQGFSTHEPNFNHIGHGQRRAAVFQERVGDSEAEPGQQAGEDPLPSRLMMKMFPALRPKPAPVPEQPVTSSASTQATASRPSEVTHRLEPASKPTVIAKIQELESHVEGLLATRMSSERQQVSKFSRFDNSLWQGLHSHLFRCKIKSWLY